MKKLTGLVQFLLFMLGLCSHISSYAAQLVVPAASNQQYVSPLETVSYTAVYNVSSPQTDTETGLGLRVHYDSSQITPANIQRYNIGAQPIGTISDDSEDFDADPQTDKFFILAWVDLNAQWPGNNTLPLDLFSTDFTLNAGFIGTTTINLSSTGSAEETGLQASSQHYCAKPTISITTATNNIPENTAVSPNFLIQSNISIPVTCSALALNTEVTGSATAGNDYFDLPSSLSIPAGQASLEVPLDIIDDDQVENSENVAMALLSDSNYQLTSATTAIINITNDDQVSTLPEVNLSFAKTSVNESNSGSILVYATRSNADLSAPLEVFVDLGGTASVNTDYHPFPASIIIPANRDAGFAVLILKDDGTTETTETLNLEIQANQHYQRGSTSALQLTITDDEINQNTNLDVDTTDNTPQTVNEDTGINTIPTLSEWMLILMSLLLAALATFQLDTKAGRRHP